MNDSPPASFALLPAKRRAVWTPRAFANELPHVALSIAELRFGQNGRVILEKHVLTQATQGMSFAAIGQSLGITKQWTHVLFSQIIRTLREAILEDRYRTRKFRLRREFPRPLQSLLSGLKKRSQKTFSNRDWNALLRAVWGISPSRLGRSEALVLEILGLERLTFSSPEFTPLITTASDKDRTRFKETADFIQRLLKSRYPNGLTFQEITDAIRTRFEIGSLSDDKIRALLRCVKNIEKVGQRCSIREGKVRRRADHYEQILLQAGKPLHYRVLARRAVRFGFYGSHGTSRPVKAILGNDSRFAPVGRSGFWALTQWRNVDTRILTEIAADEIQRAGRPLHEDELYSSIVKRRPVKRISIAGTLSKSSRFKKTGVRVWTIRE